MSTLTIYPEIDQRSEEWYEQRRGLLTASVVRQIVGVQSMGAREFHCPSCEAAPDEPCVSKARRTDGAPNPIKTMHPERVTVAAESGATTVQPSIGDESRSLARLLAAERITGWTDPTFVNDDMMRGILDEPKARDKYGETNRVEVDTVGFMVRDFGDYRLGYSPDGLVGDDGLIEVKCPRAKKHIWTIVNDEVPAENMAQLQAGLVVSGRKWIDFISYCGGLPMWTKRVYADPEWHHAIQTAAAAFEQSVRQITDAYHEAAKGLPMTERSPEFEEIR